MTSKRTRVIFIGGASRSGSTLLDRMLGQVQGVFSTGELRRLWDRGLSGDHLCGCGNVLTECSFWREVLRATYGDVRNLDTKRMRREGSAVERFRYVPNLSFCRLRSDDFESRLDRHHGNLKPLYQAINAVSGDDVIVDSSKVPLHGFTLMAMDAIDPYVIHLVRDSRAVAFSQQRERLRPDSPRRELMMVRMSPRTASRKWMLFNGFTQLLGARYPRRYLRVRYEDLTADPEGVIRRILVHIGLDAHPTFIRDRAARLDLNHTVSGNPFRFKSGTVEIKTDSEWRTSMDARDKRIVTGLTFPLLVSYGYVPYRRLRQPYASASI